MLNLYQLWLDDLYPRAKFADGLSIIEKLGRTKRMQTMRKEWINESKPKDTIEDTLTSTAKDTAEVSGTSKTREASLLDNTPRQPHTPMPDDPNDDDLYSATPRRPSDVRQQKGAPSDSLFVSDDGSGEYPGDDDLDQLLAENKIKDLSARPDVGPRHDGKGHDETRDDKYDDEIEAMADMDIMW